MEVIPNGITFKKIVWNENTKIEDADINLFFQQKHFAEVWNVNPLDFKKLPLKFVMYDMYYNKEMKKKSDFDKIKNENGR